MSTPEKFLAWQEAYLGYVEGANNHNIFAGIAGFADHLSWCGSFQVAAALSSRTPLPAGAHNAYTPAMATAFQRAKQFHSTPEVGDLGFVFFKSLRRIGHVFAVRAVLGNSTVFTTEGNCNQAQSRTGGQVASLYRTWGTDDGSAYIAGFGRPAWDGVDVTLANLPTKADHTGQLIIAPAAYTRSISGHLAEDGQLGPSTIRAWQHAMGTTADGAIGHPSSLVRAVQTYLNSAIGAKLRVDGEGIAQDGRHYSTVAALQGFLGCPRDGVLSPGHSIAVQALQRRLNAGAFTMSSA